MKIVKYFLLFFVVLLCTKLKILSGSPLNEGIKVLKYTTTKLQVEKNINIFYYIPTGNKKKMSVQIILHGASRNANDYIQGWKEYAEKYKLILVAPEFSNDEFTIGEYSQGMFPAGDVNDLVQKKNLFYELDEIFSFMNHTLKLNKKRYNLYGHSAGGQFVHRFLLFHDSPYVHKSIAANPGWYTYPIVENRFPYGIGNLNMKQNELKKSYYKKDMYILLGTADTLRTNNLRITKEADAQGLNRLERGNNYYILNKMDAAREGLEFKWEHGYVKDAGHDHLLMSRASALILYGHK